MQTHIELIQRLRITELFVLAISWKAKDCLCQNTCADRNELYNNSNTRQRHSQELRKIMAQTSFSK